MGMEQKCWKWRLINQRIVQTKENTIENIEKIRSTENLTNLTWNNTLNLFCSIELYHVKDKLDLIGKINFSSNLST